MKQKLICTVCGNIGYPRRAIKGTMGIEIVLWLCLLVPGIIYSLWRGSSRHNVCASCGNPALVPLNSPTGIKMLESQGKTIEGLRQEKRNQKAEAKTSAKESLTKLLKILGIGLPVLAVLSVIIGLLNLAVRSWGG